MMVIDFIRYQTNNHCSLKREQKQNLQIRRKEILLQKCFLHFVFCVSFYDIDTNSTRTTYNEKTRRSPSPPILRSKIRPKKIFNLIENRRRAKIYLLFSKSYRLFFIKRFISFSTSRFLIVSLLSNSFLPLPRAISILILRPLLYNIVPIKVNFCS
jgi:hypothetical protein